MSRFTRSILVLATLAVGSLAAQSPQSASASASVTVTPFLSLAKNTDMSFGTHFASEGTITSSAPGSSPATWLGQTDVGSSVSIFFALPTSLAGPGGATVPFSCGAFAGGATWSGGGVGLFNPSTGVPNSGPINSPSGTFTVSLGSDGQPQPDAGNCFVNLAGAHAGTYTGTVTLTIAVL